VLWLKKEGIRMNKLSLLLLFTCSLKALTEGQLDTSFNPSGSIPGTQTVTDTSLGATTAAALRAVTQSDGKIIQVGYTEVSGTKKISVARYTRDGILDTSFNASATVPGVVQTAIGSYSGLVQATGVALQSDGKVVVVGVAGNGLTTLNGIIVRYKTDGTLDTTFNASGSQPGVVETSISGFDYASGLSGVVIQSNGRIVICGGLWQDATYKIVVMRYTAAGVIDTTFGGGNGYIIKLESAWSAAIASSLRLQSDQKIVLSGYATIGGVKNFLVARFATNGDYDTTFNSVGYVTTDIGSGSDSVGTDLRIQSDGKIVIGGYATVSGTMQFALARYTTVGALDTGSFNASAGYITTNVTTSGSGSHTSKAWGVDLQADGKAVLGGYSTLSSTNYFAVARYTTAGALDTTFNDSGHQAGTNTVSLSSETGGDLSFGTVMQPDGRVILSGYIGSPVQGFGLARFIGLPVVVPAVQETDANSKVSLIGLGTGSVTKAKAFYALLREKYYDWV